MDWMCFIFSFFFSFFFFSGRGCIHVSIKGWRGIYLGSRASLVDPALSRVINPWPEIGNLP